MNTELDALAAILTQPEAPEKKIQQAVDCLVAAAKSATLEDRNRTIVRLSPLILLEDLKRAGLAATVCGALVERGADPAPMERPLLERVLPVLRRMAAEPVPEEIPEPEPEEVQPVKPLKRGGVLRTVWNLILANIRLQRALKKHQREFAARPVTADQSLLNAFAPSLIAMFSASPSLRVAHPEFRELCNAVADRVDCFGWLAQIFDISEDEPVLIIEPESNAGILALLSGVDVNFALTMVVMRDFPNPTGRPRLPKGAIQVLEGGPQESGATVIGLWNLYNWTALQSDGRLPGGMNSDQWIWNEGKPADIELFEGRRVILLGPASYQRTWPAQRTFEGIKPELRIEKVLTPDEVTEWLSKMAAAARG